MISATKVDVDDGIDGIALMLGSYPYSALNGDHPKVECSEEL